MAGGALNAVPFSGSPRCFERREEKYELDTVSAAELQAEISRHLPLFAYRKGQSCTYVTTIYFDTRNRDFYRRAEQSYDDNVKIRVKEYYYAVSPEAGGGASPDSGADAGSNAAHREAGGASAGHSWGGDPRRAAAGSPWNGHHVPGATGTPYEVLDHCFVELKQRVHGMVVKKRFAFPKTDLELLFNGDDVWPTLEKVTPAADLASLKEIYRELRRYIAQYPVEATSIVNYRRTVYQRDENDLRVTFDDQLAVFPPLPGLYTDREALTVEAMGKPIRTSERVILEIKCPGDYPGWLRDALRPHSCERLSKFTTSVRILLGSGGAGQAAQPRRAGGSGPRS